ncbi:zf-RING_2 domain-containing protein [Cephalotus follicularis]|uniref:Zf-RING_2 domain-containing protein n=1 Tax=Cephalotus follicularis TaxID=3775 RepID=A0A1Q3BRU8_CEPFO|nr:zf-RING_2 domain-containing protein [Cephalotus follicularis]
MSTQGLRGPLRGYRRRKNALDLNVPPVESRDQEGTSIQAVSHEVQSHQQGRSTPLTMIDVEAIDDDVVESSPSAFAEAKRKRRSVYDVESGRSTRFASKRQRIPPDQINFINLESSSNMKDNVTKPPPPPPPKEPIFTCPICMGQLVEEMSTKCGHIFCKTCIKAAISTQAKCPTCRKKITVKELIRVFLPSTS